MLQVGCNELSIPCINLALTACIGWAQAQQPRGWMLHPQDHNANTLVGRVSKSLILIARLEMYLGFSLAVATAALMTSVEALLVRTTLRCGMHLEQTLGACNLANAGSGYMSMHHLDRDRRSG